MSGQQQDGDFAALQATLRAFANERDWDQYHTPKNLVMALAGEVGELTEIFQWLTPDESVAVLEDPKRQAAVEDELADVLGYVLRLADVLDVDLRAALERKIQSNADKYPAERVRGSARKYTEYGEDVS